MNSIDPIHRPERIPWLLWLLLVVVALGVGVGEYRWIKKKHVFGKVELPVLAKVPDFSFTSETGATVTNGTMKGKIWIADFIFTRCAGPCPYMTQRMLQLQIATRELAREDVRLISVTVDPTNDTPDVLEKYGGRYGSDPDRWSFLTGDDEEVVDKFITKGMLLGLSKDGKGVPIHAQKFVIVDREGYIRAYHDLSEDDKLVPGIVADIVELDREHFTPTAETKKP